MENEIKIEAGDGGIIQEITGINTAKVLITSTGDCKACLSKSSCNIFNNKNRTINAVFDGDIKVGDSVIIKFDGKLRIFYSILIFLVPLISMFIFFYIANLLFKKEFISIIFSFSGLVLSFIIIFIVMKTNKKMKEFKPFVFKKEI